MTTRRRVWIEGASYHITNRGNRKEIIFREEYDFYVYIAILKNTLKFYEEYNYKVVAYCLMTNHVHLLIKTEKQDPSTFMRRLNSMYAKYFNDKYEYEGHLFQGRYYSNIITSIIEMLEVSRYIHLNPVKAKIVRMPEEYKWSSYNKTIGSENDRVIKELNIFDGEILDLFEIYSLVEEKSIKNIATSLKKKIYGAREKYRYYVESKIE